MYVRYWLLLLKENKWALLLLGVILSVFFEKITYHDAVLEATIISYRTKPTLTGENLMVGAMTSEDKMVFVKINGTALDPVGNTIELVRHKSYLSGRAYYSVKD